MSAHSAAVPITHATGLHARPAVKLTKLARTFPVAVEVALAAEGPWIDAKSVVKVMALKAPCGAVLHVRAPDAAAVAALVDLVRRDFDDGVG
jgi:phosphocarrier protein HPr